MSNIVKNRSELIFMYDVETNNPNGDPLDDNRPRYDDESGLNFVTDVRLKRTIRDYLMSNGQKILIREEIEGKDTLNKEKILVKDKVKKSKSGVIENYIDARLFGATITITDKDAKKETGGSITFTGPVQFKFGKSLNKVNIREIGNSFVMASKETGGGSLASKHIVDYSLINFYGIINEKAAFATQLTDDDVKLLLGGMWFGTNELISGSKVGHTSRVLLKINYKENEFHIGEINKLISHKSSKADTEIRSIDELEIEFKDLKDTLAKYKDKLCKKEADKIAGVQVKIDSRVKFCLNGESNKDLIAEIRSLGIDVEEI